MGKVSYILPAIKYVLVCMRVASMLYIAALKIFAYTSTNATDLRGINRVVGRGVSDAVSLFRDSADHHLFF